MEIVNEVSELVTNWMAIYGPAILSIVSSITTAVVIILKLAASIKNAKKEFATNSEVNELTKRNKRSCRSNWSRKQRVKSIIKERDWS